MLIRFLDPSRVVQLHANQIQLYGGALGVRDQGALLSAIAQPEATFGGRYLHADVFEMAAAYMFHLTQNHAFVDGNKLDPGDDNALYQLSREIAQGQHDKPAIAAYLRANSRPR